MRMLDTLCVSYAYTDIRVHTSLTVFFVSQPLQITATIRISQHDDIRSHTQKGAKWKNELH